MPGAYFDLDKERGVIGESSRKTGGSGKGCKASHKNFSREEGSLREEMNPLIKKGERRKTIKVTAWPLKEIRDYSSQKATKRSKGLLAESIRGRGEECSARKEKNRSLSDVERGGGES